MGRIYHQSRALSMVQIFFPLRIRRRHELNDVTDQSKEWNRIFDFDFDSDSDSDFYSTFELNQTEPNRMMVISRTRFAALFR